MKSWFTDNLLWIIITALIVAMIGVMIWRSRAPRAEGGRGPSSKTEFTIIYWVTLVLIITALVIALQQKNIAALFEIGVAVIIYVFFRKRIVNGHGSRVRGRSGAGGIKAISSSEVKDEIMAGRKRLYLRKLFESKLEASNYVISMKKQYGDGYAFRKRSAKTSERGVVWGVYSDLR